MEIIISTDSSVRCITNIEFLRKHLSEFLLFFIQWICSTTIWFSYLFQIIFINILTFPWNDYEKAIVIQPPLNGNVNFKYIKCVETDTAKLITKINQWILFSNKKKPTFFESFQQNCFSWYFNHEKCLWLSHDFPFPLPLHANSNNPWQQKISVFHSPFLSWYQIVLWFCSPQLINLLREIFSFKQLLQAFSYC